MKKFLFMATLLLSWLPFASTSAQNVAKVGTTEYATIEEAIEAWGPGKTLTLLADVTTTSTVTVEVNATKSTQNWTLDLGDYTWTASGCNAFQLYAAGGTVMNQNYGLKVYANQNGGIKASGKYCIECKYDNSTAGYRPRLEIHGGTYNGSYIIYYASLTYNSNSVSNGPSTWFYKSNDGSEPIFNGNFALAKCPITINAGYFNGTSFNTYPVSSTANTNLNGGHFKTINAFPSANNNKGIVFGNYKVFVRSDASIDMTNGAPATYEAKATKTLLLSSNQSVNYSDYIYYEKANDAIQKYSSGTIEIILSEGVTATADKSFRTGTLTIDATAEGSIYTGNITLTGNNAKSIIKFPEGCGYYGTATSTGSLHVVETVVDGVVTRTYSIITTVSNPEAKVGSTNYSTVYDAFYAIDGTTGNTIVLQKDVTNAGIVTNGTATGGDGKTEATFDLNGKSIGIGSVAAGNNADYTLTIIDSSEGKTGTVTNSDASLIILALTGINDYSGSYTLKVRGGKWQFDPSAVNINGETHNLVDEGYVSKDNGDGTWTVEEIPPVAKIGEQGYVTLQAAVDAAQQIGGEVTVNIISDISGETVTIQEVANFKLTIDGQKDESTNYTVDAVIVVDGLRGNGGSTTNGASVTLQNIAFVKTTATDGIQATHYPHHLTIQNCTYSGYDNDKWFLNASVDGPLYGVTVKNVTVENARLIYANLADDAVFQNITATNDIKVGFNVKTSGTALIESCQVTTGKYAFRDYSDGYEGSFTLKDNTFISTSEESDEGVIVNRGGAAGTASINVVSGTYTGRVTVLNGKTALNITGGTFSVQVPDEYLAEGYGLFNNNDGTYTVQELPDVAQIGDVKYKSLQAALDAAYEMTGDVTIELIDNIEGYSIVRQKAGLNLTIDGANKKVSGNIVVDGNGRGSGTETLTIQNIQFEGDGSNFCSGTSSFVEVPSTKTAGTPFYTGAYNYAHNITIDNCSFTSTTGDLTMAAIRSTSGAGLYNITISNTSGSGLHSLAQLVGTTGGSVTNCTVTESESFVNVNGGSGDFIISGNTFTSAEGADGYGIRENGTSTAGLNLTDNTFTAASAVVLGKTTAVTAGTINVISGTYFGEITKTDAATGSIVISGGTYSIDVPAEYIIDGYYSHNNGDGTYTVQERPYVAQIGDEKYKSLAEAVAAVPADGTQTTITMIEDEIINVSGYAITIAASKNVVLDLNGHQVVGTVEQEGTSALIRNLGTLTIKDSSDTNMDGSGTGKLMSGATPTWTWDGTDDYSGSYASNLIRNEKNLIVESGLLYNMSKGSAAYAIDNYNAGNVTINGGKVDAAKASAIRMFYVSGGSISVTGGVIGHYNSDDDCAYMGIQVMSGANVNISVSGGTIAGMYALYANNTGGSIAISGGTFDGYVGFAAACTNDISITGGSFVEWVGTWGEHVKFISGGLFASPVDEDYWADGFILTDNIDPETKDRYPYSMKEGQFVAKIGTAKYETLEAAFAAAQDGETITLLANCAGNGIQVPQGKYTTGLTVDFGGFTYTVDGATVGSTGTQTQAFQLLKDNKITFQNGTIYSEKAKILVQNYSNLTLEGMTLTLDNENYTSAYTLSNNNGTIVIDGSTINANPAGGFAFDVCRYASYTSVNVEVKGNSTINGNIEISASGNDAKDGFGLALNGGTMTGNIVLDASAVAAMEAAPDKASITKGDAFEVDAPAGYKWVSNGDGTSSLAPCVYVAQIGDVKYESLADAVAAVPADGTATTITMINNEMINVVGSAITIPATKNVVIDLNGYQVVGTAEGGSTSALITNRGTLTIKDSSDTNADDSGTGQLISGATTTWIYDGNGNYAGSYASNTITNSGTLTIESGYIENLSTGSATYAVDNNSSGANAILNVEGGILKARSVAVRQFANSTTYENTVNVSGGTITAGYSAIWIQLPGSDTTKAMKAALNVEDGTLTGGSYAFYDYTYGNAFTNTQYNLDGGTFNGMIFSYGANVNITDGTYNGDVAIKQTNPSTVSVSGGTFAGDVYTYGANASEAFITGGKFATITYEDEGQTYYCDWIYCLAEDCSYGYSEETGMYEIIHVEAQVGDVKYETFAEAAEEANGEVITLLANVEDAYTIAVEEILMVKLNGHTLTVNAPASYTVSSTVADDVTTYSVPMTERDIVLTDGQPYSFTTDTQVKTASYVRNVSKADVYCAWYVPFDYTIPADETDLTFYRINLIANSPEQGGEVEGTDQIWIYLSKMNPGEKLTANRPYVFKSATTGELTFTVENATLSAPVTSSRLDNSTTAYRYDFYGTYASTTFAVSAATPGTYLYYVNGNGQISKQSAKDLTLGSYRWYIRATQKEGGPNYAPVFVFVDDNDDAAGISQMDNMMAEESYYNLNGMRINKPARGAYIIKYKDGSVKKIMN